MFYQIEDSAGGGSVVRKYGVEFADDSKYIVAVAMGKHKRKVSKAKMERFFGIHEFKTKAELKRFKKELAVAIPKCFYFEAEIL
jgi:hypothetical protein